MKVHLPNTAIYCFDYEVRPNSLTSLIFHDFLVPIRVAKCELHWIGAAFLLPTTITSDAQSSPLGVAFDLCLTFASYLNGVAFDQSMELHALDWQAFTIVVLSGLDGVFGCPMYSTRRM